MHPPSDLDVVSALVTLATASVTPDANFLLPTGTMTAAFLNPAPTTTTSPFNTVSPDDSSPTECRLLGPFALLVQLALGGLALLALVYKRWRERPQRPVKVWA